MERRLAAILAADVVGYSRLMGADETGTLDCLKSHLAELIQPEISCHGGRIFKLMGDGILAEFQSVVEAVECAVAIQSGMAQRNAEISENRRIVFRIGVNLGDVLIDSDDVHGDGVNVASRLQAIAEPGSICISRAARDQIRDKLDLPLDDLGEIRVKNITRPVRAFRIGMGAEKQARRSRPALGATNGRLALLVLLILAGAWLVWVAPWRPELGPASTARMAHPLPNVPSLAVLPFANLSDDPEHDYLSDGITLDLTTDLSKLDGLFVIARNSTFTYKGRPVPATRAAEELGVRYVLEGSVRRVGERVRINAQLIDALDGRHLWAERYDGTMKDVLDLQDNVTRSIVHALKISLPAGDEPRTHSGAQSADAYDAYLRGWAHFRRHSPDDFAKALEQLRRAKQLDPQFAPTYAALAAVYSAVLDNNWSTSTSYWSNKLGMRTDEVVAALAENLEKALSQELPLAYSIAAASKSRLGRHEEAITDAQRAIKLDPNDPSGHLALASSLIYAGRPQKAPAVLERALRLDPKVPHEYLYRLGLAHFGMEQFERAAQFLSTAAEVNPDDDRSYIVLAAAYGQLGDPQKGRAMIERANRIRIQRQKRFLAPGWRPGIDYLLVGPYTLKDVDLWPFKRTADRERLKQGLRLIGVPAQSGGGDVSPLEVPGATTVDTAEAKALHESGALFVDVRQPAMWNSGHIPGAVHLDFTRAFSESALAAVAERDRELVIYCMGSRCLLSAQACAAAVSWGFKKVYYFRDGFPAWKAAGHPVAMPDAKG